MQAGMDEYLSKPMRRHELLTVLGAVANGQVCTPQQPVEHPPTPQPPEGDPAMHLIANALANLGGNEQLLHDVVIMFLEVCPEMMTDMEQAVMQGNMESLARRAHQLVSAVGNFAFGKVSQASQDLELAADHNDMATAMHAWGELNVHLETLNACLREFVQGGFACKC